MSPRICTSTNPFGSAMKMQAFSQHSPWLLLFRGRHTQMFTVHRPHSCGRFFFAIKPPFHFDAPIVSLAKHRPSLSEIPAPTATPQSHFSAIHAHISAHTRPFFSTKNAIFHQILPFFAIFTAFSDIPQKIFSVRTAKLKKLARL